MVSACVEGGWHVIFVILGLLKQMVRPAFKSLTNRSWGGGLAQMCWLTLGPGISNSGVCWSSLLVPRSSVSSPMK